MVFVQLEESRVFTASSSLANATIYNSMCTATTTAVSAASIFDQSSLSAQPYVTGSTSATSRNTTTSVDSRASVLADSAAGSVYQSNTMPSGSLSSHASLSSGQVLFCCLQYSLYLHVCIRVIHVILSVQQENCIFYIATDDAVHCTAYSSLCVPKCAHSC